MLLRRINFCICSSNRNLASYKIVKSSNPENLSDIQCFTPDRIRNFGIVAHVDHGKSSLADRFLQMTNVINSQEREQFLDKLQVERERGITVKAQTCSMVYKDHLLNLIDTPGHADFSFEVSRSLAALDGIILLVAANQGVQAQTLANFWLAFEREIVTIPVINKIDLKEAKIQKVEEQMYSLFDFKSDEILKISAKNGINVEAVLDTVLEKVPSPKVTENAPFRALIFDSWFEHFRGAIAMIAVKDGLITKGQKIASYNGQKEYEVVEVGIMYPNLMPTTV
uniref:Tr-type G domain-containing protein n=1 Tax=Panagrolaimus davidi TaxID=227884 RepID=A0A914QD95_9BILA